VALLATGSRQHLRSCRKSPSHRNQGCLNVVRIIIQISSWDAPPERDGESRAVERPVLRRRLALLSALAHERGDFRLQFRDRLVLSLRLVRELPEKLQDLADQVLRPSVGVQSLLFSLELAARQNSMSRTTPQCPRRLAY
jgi:hypothetical protein